MVAAVPYPDMAIQIAFNANANSSDNPRWTDLTELVTGASQLSRGHPYQVPQAQTSTPVITLRDVLEQLNPVNTNSPYVNGLGGKNIQPYRGIVWQALHPRGGTGNLLNLSNWRVPIDPSFESYTVGTTPPWVLQFGSNPPQITTTGPLQGTKSLAMTITNGGGLQAAGLLFPCMPGRYYRISCLVKQSVANTVSLWVGGHTDMTNTTATITTTLTGIVCADQPSLQLEIGCRTPGITGTLTIDAIMIEPVYPVNSPTNFNKPAGFVGAGGATVTQTNRLAGFHLGSLSIVPDGVTSGPTARGPEFPVSPGTAYALGVAAYAPSLNRNYGVEWYDSGHLLISSSTVAFTPSATPDWSLRDPSGTVTSPVNAAFGRMVTSGTGVISAGASWLVDALDLVPATPAAFTTSGPVIYPVLRDWVESWPRRYESSGFEAYADLQLVDGLAALAAIGINTDLNNAIRALAPDYWWMLNETGNTAFADNTQSGKPSLVKTDNPFGPGTFTPGTPTNVPGDAGGTGITTDTGNNSGGTLTRPGTYAQTGQAGTSTPPVRIGGNSPTCNYSAMIVASRGVPTDPFDEVMTSLYQSPFNGKIFASLFGANTPPAQFGVSVEWPGNLLSFVTSDKWDDGKPHIYVVTVALTTTTAIIHIWVDGVHIYDGSGTPGVVTGFTGPWFADVVTVGGYGDFGQGNPAATNGVYSHHALWNRVLSPTEITSLNTAFQGNVGELPGARVLRHLANNGYTTGTNNIPASRLSAGRSVLGPSSAVRRSGLLADAQGITLAEMGTMWIAPDGALVFESRDDRFLRLTPVQTFGEDFTNGECPYQEGANFAYDPLYVYADVQVQQTNGIVATGGLAADIAATKQQYFGRSYTPGQSLDLRDASMTQDYAHWVFYSHNTPAQRIDRIIVDPMSNPALWPVVYNAEVGQRIVVVRRPQGLTGGVAYSQQFFIEQIVHSEINFDKSGGQPWSWRTALSLTPAPLAQQPWLLDNATYSVLGSTTRLGF